MRALLLLAVGCAGTSGTPERPAVVEHAAAPAPAPASRAAVPIAQAIIGQWDGDRAVFDFTDHGRFVRRLILPCSVPPCPLSGVTGDYVIRDGLIHLAPTDGPPEVLEVELGRDQDTLTLISRAAGMTWRLSRVYEPM